MKRWHEEIVPKKSETMALGLLRPGNPNVTVRCANRNLGTNEASIEEKFSFRAR
jgi:hypothetical protein